MSSAANEFETLCESESGAKRDLPAERAEGLCEDSSQTEALTSCCDAPAGRLC